MQDAKEHIRRDIGRDIRPVPCVGVVCWRDGKVLLIRRGRAPRLGEWSIPGGRVEPMETLQTAALRELREETGVDAEITGLVEVYEIIEPGYHYVLIDYAATWTGGEPVAADDASEANFVPFEEALNLVAHDDLRDVLVKSRRIAPHHSG